MKSIGKYEVVTLRASRGTYIEGYKVSSYESHKRALMKGRGWLVFLTILESELYMNFLNEMVPRVLSKFMF